MTTQIHDNKLKGYVTLAEIVMDYKNSIGDYSMTDYARYMQILIRGVVKINKGTITNVEVVHLTPDSINCLNLPDDYIKYTKVGLNINERIWLIPYNNNIIIPQDEECGLLTRETETSNSNTNPSDQNVDYFVPYFRNSSYYPTQYGTRGGYSQVYFKEDRKNNRLILEGEVPSGIECIVEYISSGVSLNSQTMIPREAEECLLAWLRWQLNINNTYYMNLYGIEKDELRNFNFRFDKEEFLDTMNSSYRQTIGR